jgi:vacuolar iron transporter family protein
MGVGGYFATKSERDNYRYLLRHTRARVENSCSAALEREVLNILSPYGLDSSEVKQIVERLQTVDRNTFESDAKDSGHMTDFLLKFGQGVEAISTWQLYASATTIGLSYMLGGLIPMVSLHELRLALTTQIPYFIIHSAVKALFVSIGITALVLLLFGALKGYLTGSCSGPASIIVSALQTLVVGALAAGASYGIVRALDKNGMH